LGARAITKCRVCDSRALSAAMPGADPARAADEDPASRPAAYVVCDASKDATACGAVQAADAVARADAGIAPVEADGADAAARLARVAGFLRPDTERFLEIGSTASGEARLRRAGRRRLARPADVQAAFRADLSDAPGGEYDAVVSRGVLEAAEAPLAHAKAVRRRLAARGVWLFETAYAPTAVAQARADLFREPVRAVYSICSSERLLRRAGLKPVRAALVDDARTLRIAAVRQETDDFDDPGARELMAELWDAEAALDIRRPAPYEALVERFAEIAAASRAALLASPEPRVFWREDAPARAHARRLGLDDLIEPLGDAAERTVVAVDHRPRREILEDLAAFIDEGGVCVVSGVETARIDSDAFPLVLANAIAASKAPAGVATLQAVLRAAGRPRLVRDAARSLGG